MATAFQPNKTFEIEEASIQFEASEKWEQVSKTGRLDYGKVQYSFTHPHVEGAGRQVNPALIITVDKGSWFENDQAYLEDKLGFHETMGDQLEKSSAFGEENNPLRKLQATYTIGTSGNEDDPYGQLLVLVSFWKPTYGFHLELHTSKKDFQENPERYQSIFETITISE